MLGSHHQFVLSFGMTAGFWKSSAGKHDPWFVASGAADTECTAAEAASRRAKSDMLEHRVSRKVLACSEGKLISGRREITRKAGPARGGGEGKEVGVRERE